MKTDKKIKTAITIIATALLTEASTLIIEFLEGVI